MSNAHGNQILATGSPAKYIVVLHVAVLILSRCGCNCQSRSALSSAHRWTRDQYTVVRIVSLVIAVCLVCLTVDILPRIYR